MRKKALRVAVAVAVAIGAASAWAAPDRLGGQFTIHFPKGHAATTSSACPPDSFCGDGSVAGLGRATISILEETFADIPASPCLRTTRIEEIVLTDGSGSLVLVEAGTFCRPGRSGDSHAAPTSYGNPGQWRMTYTIDAAASTGVFEGASGSGVVRFTSAGGVGAWHVSGGL